MKIVDQKYLDSRKGPGPCDVCGKHCRGRVPHHVMHRGRGSANRLDIPINILWVGAVFECTCHDDCDRYRISRTRQLEIVAAREKWESADAVETELFRLIRADKDGREKRR